MFQYDGPTTDKLYRIDVGHLWNEVKAGVTSECSNSKTEHDRQNVLVDFGSTPRGDHQTHHRAQTHDQHGRRPVSVNCSSSIMRRQMSDELMKKMTRVDEEMMISR